MTDWFIKNNARTFDETVCKYSKLDFQNFPDRTRATLKYLAGRRFPTAVAKRS